MQACVSEGRNEKFFTWEDFGNAKEQEMSSLKKIIKISTDRFFSLSWSLLDSSNSICPGASVSAVGSAIIENI